MLSGTGARQFLVFVFALVLAHILSPTDFAAVALVTAILTVLESVAQLGTSVALVQRAEVTQEVLDSAFVLSIPLFFAGGVILLVASGWLAAFFSMPLLSPLIRVAALGFVVQGIASFHQSMMMRSLDFSTVAVIQMIAATVYGVTAILVAQSGYGAFGVVWGNVAGAMTSLAISAAVRPFRPRSLGAVRHMNSLVRFGSWISMGRTIGVVATQMDRFIIGRVLTESTLGGYYLAQRLAMGLPNVFATAVDQVLLPIYASSKNDPETIERGYWKGLQVSAMLVVPMTLVLTAYPKPIVWLLFGESWMYIVPMVQLLSVVAAIQATGGGVYSSAVYASNKPFLSPMANAFRVAGLPLCVWIGSRWDIMGVVWALAAYAIVGRLFNQWLLSRYLGYSLQRYFATMRRPVLAHAGLLAVGLPAAERIVLDNPATVLVVTGGWIGVTLTVYVALCFWLLPGESRLIRDQADRIGRSSLRRLALALGGNRP